MSIIMSKNFSNDTEKMSYTIIKLIFRDHKIEKQLQN